MKPRFLTLRDGRRLCYTEYGAADGSPIMYCHGFPGSRLEARLTDAAATRLGFRVIAADRPGYGGSDFLLRRQIGDWPADVEQLAAALGLERFGLLGVSGGGPYAAACARFLPRSVSGAAIVCGLGPVDVPGALDGMRAPARLLLATARRAPGLLGPLWGPVSRLIRAKPAPVFGALARFFPAPDRAVLADPRVRAAILASFREAARPGPRGTTHELKLYTRPWGFDPGAIAVPVALWHGESDDTVPVGMGRRLAAGIPGCRAHFLPGEGHFSLPVRYMEAILESI